MHLDEGTIHAWLDGALDAEEASRVEQHAAECAACAASIAEARGLVAGASRILTALDGVSAGIVPKAAASGGPRSRRTRSLWTTLRLTPARAAAAAIVVVAAGTALVLHNAPNAARSAVKLATYPADSVMTIQPAAPMMAPHAAPDTTPANRVLPSPTASRRAVVGQRAAGRAGGFAVAERAKAVHADVAALADSTRAERTVDSIARQKEAPMARKAVADNAAQGAVAGAATAPAPAPPSAASRQYAPILAADAQSMAGCYLVTTDSAIAVPPRLWLDSALVARGATLQQQAVDRHGVSEIVNDTRRSIVGAYWTPRRNGSIRLSLPASALNLDFFTASTSTLVGTTIIGDRSVTVTLRRAECGP